jgi:glycine cleavage system H lipoate-binding protein
MAAGVVDFKLCDREFECDTCPFDLALRDHTHWSSATIERATSPRANLAIGDPRVWSAEGASIAGYSLRNGVFYHPLHVWARIEDEGRVRIGLDDFAQRLVGAVYAVLLPAPGTGVQAGESCWRITHRCGGTDLVSPVTGTIHKINHKLREDPVALNRDPYGEGWSMLVEPQGLGVALRQLAFGHRARSWLGRSVELLTDRIAELSRREAPALGPTMHDGGTLPADFTRILDPTQSRKLIDSFLTCPATIAAPSVAVAKTGEGGRR